MSTTETVVLPYREHHIAAVTTLVLIHGGMSSGDEDWRQVIPHLTGYHVLVPDLPGHGAARQLYPNFTVNCAVQSLATLIRRHAHQGKAHVVAFSLGAHVAVSLFSQHPELVLDAVVTGYNIFPSVNSRLLAMAFWSQSYVRAAIMQLVASFPSRRAVEASGYPPPDTSFAAWRALTDTLCNDKWPTTWPARTLIIAAGRPGFPTFGDDPVVAVKLQNIGRQRNPQTKAYGSQSISHPWPMQNPRLFSQVVISWLENGLGPTDLEDLSL